MRFLFCLAIAALFFSGFAGALSVQAPETLPQNISWGFSVKLDPTDSWSKVNVKVDSTGILDVYSNGTISLDPFNGQFVIKAFVNDEDPKSTSGLVLYVSHFGLNNGEHVVTAAGDGVSDSKKVLAFAPLDSSYKADVDSRLAAMQGSVDVIAKNEQGNAAFIEAQKKRIDKAAGDFDERAGELDKKIESVNSGLSSLGSKVDETSKFAKSKFSSVEEWVASLDTNQSRTEAALLLQEQAKQKARVSGFFNIASDVALPVTLGVGIIVFLGIAFVVFVILRKNIAKAGSLYGKRDEYDLPVSGEHDEMADAISQGGKWAKK